MVRDNEDDLKEWIRKELVIKGEHEALSATLNSVKEQVKKYLRLSEDHKRIILLPPANKLEGYWQVYLYFIGKAYATLIGIYQNFHVTGKELEGELKIPGRSIRRYLKTLREKKMIIQVKRGLYKIEYSRIEEAFSLLEKEVQK